MAAPFSDNKRAQARRAVAGDAHPRVRATHCADLLPKAGNRTRNKQVEEPKRTPINFRVGL